MPDDERPSALLTKAQRRFLRGEELTPVEERAMRARIRERVKTAIEEDFPLLFDGWENRDRKQVFEDIGMYNVPEDSLFAKNPPQTRTPTSVAKSIAFFLLDHRQAREIQRTFDRAIGQFERELGMMEMFSVEVEASLPSHLGAHKLENQLQEREMRPAEIKHLYDEEMISFEVYQKLTRGGALLHPDLSEAEYQKLLELKPEYFGTESDSDADSDDQEE